MTDKPVDALTHKDKRANIPTAELEGVMDPRDREAIRLEYDRRNADLDPQLIWRGKGAPGEDPALTVAAPPIFVQEQVHPKALIDDLKSGRRRDTGPSLFDHFGVEDDDREAEVEFYRHSKRWSNRMILGDSLQVMGSLAEREGLRGKVQCIYIDPPYGIKFNSNFQWSTTSRDVKDGKLDHLTREPEQVKAFRDTWRDGIHSYLGYLRDRLVVARDLLTESGSCFVQIGDENVHRVRMLMDEVFGEDNFLSLIQVQKTGSQASKFLAATVDFVVWYAKDRPSAKYRQLYDERRPGHVSSDRYDQIEGLDGSERRLKKEELRRISGNLEGRIFRHTSLISSGQSSSEQKLKFCGRSFEPNKTSHWKTTVLGLENLARASRVAEGSSTIRYKRYLNDFPVLPITDRWESMQIGTELVYVVQTSGSIVARCILMTTDPGDIVLDPTCGSGTTAFVAEQWGRRWITVDTSRVALALARARIMGARYPYYLLADSEAGQAKEAEVTRAAPATTPTHGDIRHGFVYQRVPHITLKSIANNTEIDVIWDRLQPAVETALENMNASLEGFPARHPIETGGRKGGFVDFTSCESETLPSGEEADRFAFLEWEVPRKPGSPMNGDVLNGWQHIQNIKNRLKRTETSHRKNAPAKENEELRRKLAEAVESLNEEFHAGSPNKPTSCLHLHFEIDTVPDEPILPWPKDAVDALAEFWEARIARQREIDASIAAKADTEFLYDKPYEDKKRVRVAGPFTVESLSPHSIPAVDQDGELIDDIRAAEGGTPPREQEAENYLTAILENLKASGVHQTDKGDRITFTSLKPWPGEMLCAEGRYMEGETERRAGIFIGGEYATVRRADLVASAREAADAGFDLVIACGFNFEAHAQDFERLGAVRVLKARMNPDLHMAGELKSGGGNLFVVFGEPDIELIEEGDKLRVKILGVDVFRPQEGTVESTGPEGIACWFVDTDYDMQSFFVRHAYFLGANDPYKSLKTTLKADIDEEAWETLNSDISRAFPRPKSGRVAVKAINHLGDEVMKVFEV